MLSTKLNLGLKFYTFFLQNFVNVECLISISNVGTLNCESKITVDIRISQDIEKNLKYSKGLSINFIPRFTTQK